MLRDGDAMTVGEKVTGFIKSFGAELALEFYHDDIAARVKDMFQQHTIESLAQLIKNSEEFKVPDSFVTSMREYEGVVRGYGTETLAKIIYELLGEVRPDLAKTLDVLGDEAAAWFLRCTEAIRDKILNPERYKEEIEKALTVMVTCDSCHRSFRIFREDAESMAMCPFCGAKGEKAPPEESPEEEE